MFSYESRRILRNNRDHVYNLRSKGGKGTCVLYVGDLWTTDLRAIRHEQYLRFKCPKCNEVQQTLAK
jgi:hypothetical protein